MKPRKSERPILFKGHLVKKILSDYKTQTRRLVKNLKVIPRKRVTADYPYMRPELANAPWLLAIDAGKRYPAQLNPQGAVSAQIGIEKLGLKPGEFDFVCPYAECTTRLENHRWILEPVGIQKLWVREQLHFGVGGIQNWFYRADDAEVLVSEESPHYRQMVAWAYHIERDYCPSIHMPRFASRVTLQVMQIRLERLQQITWSGIRSEGFSCEEHDFEGGFCCSECHTLRQTFIKSWNAINADRDGSYESNPWVWAVEFRRMACQTNT